jgi:SURF1 family
VQLAAGILIQLSCRASASECLVFQTCVFLARSAPPARQRALQCCAGFKSSANTCSSAVDPSASSADAARKAGAAFFAALIAFTAGLGSWQAYRYQWKVDLVEQRTQQLSAPPVDLPPGVHCEDVTGQGGVDLVGKRVRVKGVFDHSKEVLIGAFAINCSIASLLCIHRSSALLNYCVLVRKQTICKQMRL